MVAAVEESKSRPFSGGQELQSFMRANGKKTESPAHGNFCGQIFAVAVSGQLVGVRLLGR
jgi:hypothetical protein